MSPVESNFTVQVIKHTPDMVILETQRAEDQGVYAAFHTSLNDCGDKRVYLEQGRHPRAKQSTVQSPSSMELNGPEDARMSCYFVQWRKTGSGISYVRILCRAQFRLTSSGRPESNKRQKLVCSLRIHAIHLHSRCR